MTMSQVSDEPAAGAELDVVARLALSIGELGDAAARLAAARERIAWEDCHTIPLAALAGTGAALVDERWQPRPGWAWQVLLLTVTFGAGATSAVLYESASVEGLIPNNALRSFLPDAANMATWEPKGLLVLPGHQLSWLAAGGPVTVAGRAVEVRLARLPDYLI